MEQGWRAPGSTAGRLARARGDLALAKVPLPEGTFLNTTTVRGGGTSDVR